MSDERRGSVTCLLQLAPDYYSPPSPRELPEFGDDCWDELRPRPRRAPKRTAEATRSGEESADADMKKEKEGDPKAAKPRPKTAPPAALKGEQGRAPPKTPKDAHTQTEQKGETAEEEDQDTPPPKPVFMRGCSSAYQNAVEHVRGPTVVPSVVVLGLPDSEEKKLLPFPYSAQMDRSSFVAMAASKLKLKSKAEDDHLDDWSDSFAYTRDRRRDREAPPGRKFFEDAYIATWSQSILPADESLFAITFNATEKASLRTRRVSLQKLTQEEETPESRASEWSDWRSVHDRVDEWLRDNGRLEPDESHMLALLQDLDSKKPFYLR